MTEPQRRMFKDLQDIMDATGALNLFGTANAYNDDLPRMPPTQMDYDFATLLKKD